MEIAVNKYEIGDLVILNDPEYKNPFGDFPYLASVEYSANAFNIRANYKDSFLPEKGNPYLSSGGFYYPDTFELLNRFLIVVPFDTSYTNTKYGKAKLCISESEVIPFFYQRNMIITDKRDNDSYTIYKIEAKLHEQRGRKMIRTGINFLAKNLSTERTTIVSYADLIKHFDL